MNLTVKYMTKNDCYRAGQTITPKGIMIHSTATPGVMAADWYTRWNKAGIKACVHAFLDDKGVYQYLPWNHRGWHGGGTSNNTHIGCEICEPAGFKYSGGSTMVGYDVAKNAAYFKAAWNNAVELCVMLCKQYGLNETHILCHSEGYKQGIATNHGDVMHWFPKHGENMDTFRSAVKKALAGGGVSGGGSSAGGGGSTGGGSTGGPNAAGYQVKVDTTNLNIRTGPGTNHASTGKYTGKGVFTIVEEATGTGASKWGLLQSYAGSRNGWISLDYATKVAGSGNATSSPGGYVVRVDTTNLNIRKGPGTNHGTVGKYTGKGLFTIVEEATGTGASKWGLLKSYAAGRDGWISLDYATRV